MSFILTDSKQRKRILGMALVTSAFAAPERVSPAEAYRNGWLDGLRAATDTTKEMA